MNRLHSPQAWPTLALVAIMAFVAIIAGRSDLNAGRR